jgi:Uma2 family endonuclease
MRLHGHAARVSHTLLPVELRHVRPVQPLLFDVGSNPEWNELGQTPTHARLCIFLFELLELATTKKDSCGFDEFVFYDASNPKKCLAPDGFVKLGVSTKRSSWRSWEHGAPELCVEVVSGSDREPIPMKEKLVRYRTLGTRELVLFDHEQKSGKRLRVFDRIEGDFVERVVENDRTPCLTLGLHWVVAPAPELDVALRLARDAEGADLLFSAKEQLEKLRAGG